MATQTNSEQQQPQLYAFPMIQCALNEHEYKHIAEDPLLLSCGHWSCRKCVKFSLPYSKLKCNICQKLNDRDINQEIHPQLFDFILKQNIKQVFKQLAVDFKDELKQSSKVIMDIEQCVGVKVEYLKEEIQIHTESIKNEVDKVLVEFNSYLDDLKDKWKETAKFDEILDRELLQKELKELIGKVEGEGEGELDKENIYKNQNRVQELKEFISYCKSRMPEIEFKRKKINIDKSFAGRIFYSLCDNDDEIVERIKNNNFDNFNIAYRTHDVCVLPNNNNLLLCCHSNVAVYDSNQILQRTLTQINNQQFYIVAADTNKIDAIYFCDQKQHSIIKTNLDFIQLAIFGGYGSGTSQLSYPNGLCYHDDLLFVCDHNNQRIQKLNSDLKYQVSYQLTYYPWRIKCINNVAVIKDSNEMAIYFYEIDTFKHLRKYEGHNGVIGVSNAFFYEYYANNKTFYCYDKNGNLKDTVVNVHLGFGSNSNGSIVIHKSKFYVSTANNLILNETGFITNGYNFLFKSASTVN